MMRRAAAVLVPVVLSVIVTSSPASAPPITDDMRGFNPAAVLDTGQAMTGGENMADCALVYHAPTDTLYCDPDGRARP